MNDKILDKECRELLICQLKEVGIKDAATIVNNKYKEVLHNKALKILKDFVAKFESKRYDEAYKMLCYSPAGDDMGGDNHYLDLRAIGFEDFGWLLIYFGVSNE